MSERPLLQLALDYIELPPALAMAYRVHEAVDIIEIGTPLCTAVGMDAVAAVRALCPGSLILADVKAPDVGALTTRIAMQAGANWVTLIGSAPPVTIREALGEAAARQGQVLVELTGLHDTFERARGWLADGVERLVYHVGWDEINVDGRRWQQSDIEMVGRLIEMGFKVSVAGGLSLDHVPMFRGVPVSVFVVGRAIRGAEDPIRAAHQLREALAEACTA
ncbi:MAG: 3-keto-L-gulonate-6-phosphate decarboxylase UlaD [Anaerolineae bacterium]